PLDPPQKEDYSVAAEDADSPSNNGDDNFTMDMLASGFKDFWLAYPQYKSRKGGRKECFAYWKRHNLSASREQIMKALAVAKAIWVEDGNQFMKGPLPWLRQEPWLEEQVTPQQSREAAQEAHTQEVLSMFRRLADEEKQENAGE
ncbi:MAG: hypothetical protein ABIH03_17395, partial [Pseudomonadota bacterium]